MLRLGDEPLTPAVLAAAARADGPLELELTAGARERMAAAHRTMAAATHLQDVYGRTTGVGANRDVQVDAEEARAHSVRLLRSHAGGMGRSRTLCARASSGSTWTSRLAPTPVVRP